MKKKVNGCAIIEIGANSIRMGVFQISKSELVCIDRLDYPLNIGHEIFQYRNVEFSTINELNVILSKFKMACASFGIDDIKVVSTTVMREAENRQVIADRVLIANNLEVTALPDSYEKSLLYFDIINRLRKDNENYNNAVIAYIGSGSIGVAKFDGKCITHSFHIPLGTVKFHDILSSLRNAMTDYHSVIEEYLHPVFSRLNLSECDCLILTGVQMDRVAQLCGSEKKVGLSTLERTSLRSLHHELKALTGENIAKKYNLSENDANMLSTTLSISYELTKSLGNNTKLVISEIDLERVIATQILMPSVASAYKEHIHESSLQVAMIQAEKYNCNPMHYQNVTKMGNLLFDKLKKVHGLDEKYKKNLEIASILHSCGEYINTRQRTNCSFDVIKNMDIYGLSQDDMKLSAFIAASNEFFTPTSNDLNFRLFADNNGMVIAKLAAIFRLANALDKSQKGKLTIKTVKIEDDKLIIRAIATQPAFLEEWAFNQCSVYFAEIFGIKPQITIKSQLL